MAALYFFANVIGGGAGTLLTGVLSDKFAVEAMHLAGASELTTEFKAVGLSLAHHLPTHRPSRLRRHSTNA